jgi:UDP-GlcNAc:undecaprenyl-phosphate GlcNAc-1-phosphate transferase
LSAYFITCVVIFCLSLTFSLLLTQLAKRLAPRLGLMDRPGGRREHFGVVSRFGALPLWGAFTLTSLIAQHMPVERGDPLEVVRLTGLLIGGTFLFFMGILDDKYELPAVPQYIIQIIAAAIGVGFLIFIERLNNPFTGDTLEWPYIITVGVSLFWLGLMMNTLNFLDGVDGLAGGVAFIAAMLLFVHTLREQQLSVSLLPLALMGTMLGYLRYNWHPATIFMGSGAVYLGYTLGALSIIGGAKMATILLVMGLPLLDVAWQAARRLAEGKNPLMGDRGHTHFRLKDAHVDPRIISIGYYFFCAAFGVLALLTTSRIYKFIAIVVMVALVLIGFTLVARIAGPVKSDSEVAKSEENNENSNQ